LVFILKGAESVLHVAKLFLLDLATGRIYAGLIDTVPAFG
jgi:hypothetical protein